MNIKDLKVGDIVLYRSGLRKGRFSAGIVNRIIENTYLVDVGNRYNDKDVENVSLYDIEKLDYADDMSGLIDYIQSTDILDLELGLFSDVGCEDMYMLLSRDDCSGDITIDISDKFHFCMDRTNIASYNLNYAIVDRRYTLSSFKINTDNLQLIRDALDKAVYGSRFKITVNFKIEEKSIAFAYTIDDNRINLYFAKNINEFKIRYGADLLPVTVKDEPLCITIISRYLRLINELKERTGVLNE